MYIGCSGTLWLELHHPGAGGAHLCETCKRKPRDQSVSRCISNVPMHILKAFCAVVLMLEMQG